MNHAPYQEVFVSCLPGLESLLYEELLSIGIVPNLIPSSDDDASSIQDDDSDEEDSDDDAKKKKKKKKEQEENYLDMSGAFDTTHRGGFSFYIPHSNHHQQQQQQSLELLQNQIMQCHLHLGTASHVYLRCGEVFSARNMEELRRKVSLLSFWKRYIDIGQDEKKMPKLKVRVNASKSKLMHTVGIAQRVERGIYEALDVPLPSSSSSDEDDDEDDNEDDDNDYKKKMINPPNINEQAIHILVNIHRDQVQISIDTSSTPLHKRGYKVKTAKAPLREDLAFALLHCAGWGAHRDDDNDNDDDNVLFFKNNFLLDPFCGSGTILIEGAAMAVGLPPGRLRPPPLFGSRLYDESKWKELVRNYNRVDRIDQASNNKEEEEEQEWKHVHIFGSDRDAGAIKAAKANARRAGVSNLVSFECYPLSSNPWLEDPNSAPFVKQEKGSGDGDGDGGGNALLVATNPPYGKRLLTKSSLSRQRMPGNKKKLKLPPGAHPLLMLYQTLGHRVGRIADTICKEEKEGDSVGRSNTGDDAGGVSNTVRAAIVSDNIDLVRKTGLKARVQFTTQHGGLTVSALTTEE